MLRRGLLTALAVIFGAATFLYSALWIYNNNWQPTVELGYETDYLAKEHCQLVTSVQPDSPAEKAGLRPGDKILQIDGKALKNAGSLVEAYSRYRPGDSVEMTVDCAAIHGEVVMTGTFRARSSLWTEGGLTEHLRIGIGDTFPILFLIVGLAVLFLRVEDPNAWLVALMFAGFIAAPGLPSLSRGLSSDLQPLAFAYRAIFHTALAPLFYFFFAVFPTSSPLNRRVPWLKWVGLALALMFALPGLGVGEERVLQAVAKLLGDRATDALWDVYNYGFFLFGLIALAANAYGAPTPETRRKLRVIFFGTVVGVVPVVAAAAAKDFWEVRIPLLLYLVFVLLLFLFPLSFAYAVVKHRVLEIPVLLKRSARYLVVQKGFTILLSLLSVAATVFFAQMFARYLLPMSGAAVPGGIFLGAAFGTVLMWTGTRVHKGVGGRIDRAFFRSAYDARQVLERLAQNTRLARQREPLAALLETEIREALHPSSIGVYLAASNGSLRLMSSAPALVFRADLSPDLPVLQELAQRGQPMELPPAPDEGGAEPSVFGAVAPECLVPLLSSEGKLTGIIALGTRLSEEPYSREDKRLLASVSSQAGVALDTIRLGEEIAERLEAERRSAQEMEFAREVQSRLFPQKLPPLTTLDYTGACLPTRQVGGDYYDFLELRPGRMALVLADIAGKGVSGALLMANLQANLRSQYARALDDLPGLLRSVNHLFYENTADNSYATMFFADYDDSTRRLRYVNCGHLPPLLIRAKPRGALPDAPARQVERLTSTSTVLGLFDRWQCGVAEVELHPGDTLVLYTDGITEATNDAGEEFGESRLIDALEAQLEQPVTSLLDTLVATVKNFSPAEQADDITLVVARCRSAPSSSRT